MERKRKTINALIIVAALTTAFLTALACAITGVPNILTGVLGGCIGLGVIASWRRK